MPNLDQITIDLKNQDIDWTKFDLLKCTRCKLCNSRRNVVPPKVVENSKILFIAEAPGADEDNAGTEPLIGRAGQVFNNCLNSVGINRYECSITNTVLCRPPNNRVPEKDEIAACSDILERTIEKINPDIIVPLGNVAFKRITKKSGITKYNGHILEDKRYPGKKIIPVVHPSFALRDPKNIDSLMFGLSQVKKMLDGKPVTSMSNVTYIDSLEKFDSMIKDLRSKPYFALDIEASALFDWKNGYIICISFSNTPGKSYVLPWIIGNEQFYKVCKDQAVNTAKRDIIDSVDEFCKLYDLEKPKFFWQTEDVKNQLQELFLDESYAKILHNYSYDYKFLENSGLVLGGTIYDTMIMFFLLDEVEACGLDALTLKFTSYGEYWKPLEKYVKSKKKSKKNKVAKWDTYAIIPINDLVPYAGTDADVTFQLFIQFYPQLEKQKLLTLYLSFLLPLTKMLMETEKNGFTVDETYREHIEKQLTKDIAEIDVKIDLHTKDVIWSKKKGKKMVEVKGINLNSNKQLGYYLYNYLRLPILGKTETGIPATDADTLEKLKPLHESVQLLLERKKKVKLLSTYVIGLKDAMWLDGKIHATFNITGTETGRLSCQRINLQNLPRKDANLNEAGINIRDLFMVSNPETHYLVEVDYSQAELRLIAEFSRDRALYNAFMYGRDPHAELALRIYYPNRIKEMEAGTIKAEDIVTKEERQKGKTANFSLVYGKHWENFAVENNLRADEALKIYTVFWDTYQGISFWKRNLIQEAYRNNHEFVSLFGRKRRMKKLTSEEHWIRAEAERQGVNFVIQAQASDYTLFGVLKVLGLITGRIDAKTVSFVHDSAIFEVKKEQLQEFLTILRDTLTVCPGVTIPMEIDVKVGQKLGSLKSWKKVEGIWQEEQKKLDKPKAV